MIWVIQSMVVGKIPTAWGGWHWQSSEPDFAQLRNRVCDCQLTNNDVIQIKALANADTATWPDEFVKVYLTNYLAGQENEYYS